MRKILLVLFCIFSVFCYSQKIEKYDTIITLQTYKSYYSYTLESPSFVIYKLYKGGGNISRNKLNFVKYNKLPHFNYSKSGYDKGHLCNAEDMANDSVKLKETFYYINCIPQTPNLNRSAWNTNERNIRDISQVDSLIIICGGCDWNNNIPQNCFKIVYSLTTKKCIQCYIFTNNDNSVIKSSPELKTKYTYSKIISLYNKTK